MQALILTAGEGTRLKPLTNELPKCLIEVAGRPILQYQLAALTSAGVGAVLVVTGAHAEKVDTFISGMTLVTTLRNAEYQKTNILYSFALGLRAMPLDQDLIVLAGDVVFEEAVITQLLSSVGNGLSLCVQKKECGDEEVKYISTPKGFISKLGKSLDPQASHGEFLGVFCVRKNWISPMKEITERMIQEGRKNGYLFDMINRLIEEGAEVRAVDMGSLLWEEIDFVEDVARATTKLMTVRMTYD